MIDFTPKRFFAVLLCLPILSFALACIYLRIIDAPLIKLRKRITDLERDL